MPSDLDRAREILKSEGLTAALVCRDKIIRCRKRGVAPLLELIDDETDLTEFSAADKVIGSAAAFLYVCLGIKKIYADVLSEGARDIFSRYGIDFSYSVLTDKIVNRSKTGLCPMESACIGITEPAEALEAIRKRLSQMKADK